MSEDIDISSGFRLPSKQSSRLLYCSSSANRSLSADDSTDEVDEISSSSNNFLAIS